ncbi:MAG: UvrD-helicase domain-containing protein, partial [Firmicutes bacterium]|nr:UvrD-helicase domain-containing protein [Candidatus Fiminaster equi]
FMDYTNLLNEQQYAAVSTDAKYARIVAGAGSGKTRVLTYRISYLISEKNVDPSKIVAIAFTNKVAAEMKERALNLLHGCGHGLSVSTFHSWCAKFLRKEIDVLQFPNNFTIMDDEDTETLIKNIGVDLGFKKNDDTVKYAIGFISANKCRGLYPEDVVLDRYASPNAKTALKIFHMYEERKDRMLSLDFDDLLLKTIKILSDFPDIQKKWQNRIDHILIDEFQDTNDVQFKLVRLLMNDNTNLYVVGDPDQTIYTWRGANQNIILNFQKTFPLAETLILSRNYRSTKTILNHANKLIAYNKKRVPKDLFTESELGGPVVVECSRRREDEATWVINQIENIVRKNPGTTYRNIAILYRAAYLTQPFESELMRRGIPYEIFGGMKFFQRREIKDVLAYFRLIYNHSDDLSFERIVNVPRRGIGDTTMDALKAEKEMAGLSYFDYIDQIQNYSTEIKAKNIMALTTIIEKIKETHAKLEQNLEAYSKVLEDFIRDLGYFEYLSSDDETAEDRIGNVKELFEDITSFLRKNPDSSFETYLENASLQTSQDEIKDGNYVSLMTIHVAKGLEYDHVFVISMADGVFPSRRTVDESGEDGQEEERRLAYVAFTRAKKNLYVSLNTGYSFILEQNAAPSQFIKEAGLEVIPKGYYTPRPQPSFEESFGFYSDRHFDGYESQMSDAPPPPKDNGITDWKVGDVAIHETFGRGIVVSIIDGTILQIEFEEHGRKSILASHPKVSKESKGALA